MRKIIVIICLFFLTIILVSCSNNKPIKTNGSEYFYFNKYISRDDENIEVEVALPVITKVKLEKVALVEILYVSEKVPTSELIAFEKIDSYEKHNYYIFYLKFTNIEASFIVESLKFNMNDTSIMNYETSNFNVIKSKYEEIDHELLYLVTHIRQFGSVPNSVRFGIVTDFDYKILDILSNLTILDTRFSKTEYSEGFLDTVIIDIDNSNDVIPLSYSFNFDMIIELEDQIYSYTHNNIQVISKHEGDLKNIFGG